MDTVSEIKKIAFLGDYWPRKCGIATFTSDLLAAVAAAAPRTECFSVAVNDLKGSYERVSSGSSLRNRGTGPGLNGAHLRRKTLSGSHLPIGLEFQRWGSLPRPSASGPVWNRSAPFGAPDSQPAIPTTLTHLTRPGTAHGDSLDGPAGSSRHQ